MFETIPTSSGNAVWSKAGENQTQARLCLQVAFLGSKVKGAPTIFFNLNHSKMLEEITDFKHFWIQRSLLHWSQLGLKSAVAHNPQSLEKRTKTNGPSNSWKLQLSVLRILPFWAENLRTSMKYMALKMLEDSNPHWWLSMAAKPQVKRWKGTS